MAQSPVKKRKGVTPERLLLDTLERISATLVGFSAVHLHLSRLRPQNRGMTQLRIVVRMFDTVVSQSHGRVFLLSSGDIVIIGRNMNTDDVEDAVQHVRDLFQNDPLVFDDPQDEEGKFSTWYLLQRDYPLFYQEVVRMAKEAQKKPAEPKRKPDTSIEPEHLDDIEKAISTLSMADMIRRQSCVTINPGHAAQVAFQEFFTSVQDLKSAVSPGINILGDRWLFQHLSQTLDRRLLPVLKNTRLFFTPPALSLNLNISTVFSPEFEKFMTHIGNKQTIIVEVQMMDVFQNINDYKEARDELRKRGHKILLDGLSALSLQFIDLPLFDADMIKLIWSPTLKDSSQVINPKQLIQDFGPERVVLARVDTEDGIQWGITAGVRAFQGHFIDAMAGAMSKSQCSHGNKCTLGQCIARRATIAGKMRMECASQKQLDYVPDITAKGKG